MLARKKRSKRPAGVGGQQQPAGKAEDRQLRSGRIPPASGNPTPQCRPEGSDHGGRGVEEAYGLAFVRGR